MKKPFSKLFELIDKKNYQPEKDELVTIRLEQIVPNQFQPRQVFDNKAMRELQHSIQQYGLLQPITVRPLEEEMYEIIAGERRFRALLALGFGETECIVRYMTDQETAAVALIENIHRSELSPIEEAQAYKRLLAIQGMTQKDLADNIGKSQSFIANKLRLLKLSEEVQDALKQFKISERHARALLNIDESTQNAITQTVIKNELGVKDTEKMVTQSKDKRMALDFSKDLSFMMNDVHAEIERLKRKGLKVETVETDHPNYKELIVRVYPND